MITKELKVSFHRNPPEENMVSSKGSEYRYLFLNVTAIKFQVPFCKRLLTKERSTRL